MRGSRLKPWKTKPSFWLRIVGELVLAEAVDAHAVELVAPAVGVSRQPRMFISVDLPEPDVPMIATISPRSMRQIDAAQRVHFVRAADVGLRELLACWMTCVIRSLPDAAPRCCCWLLLLERMLAVVGLPRSAAARCRR